METPKSMQPPEVKCQDGFLVGWLEFEHWAMNNVPIWNSAIHYSANGCCSHTDAIKLIAYTLALENRRMMAANIKHAEETGKPLFSL